MTVQATLVVDAEDAATIRAMKSHPTVGWTLSDPDVQLRSAKVVAGAPTDVQIDSGQEKFALFLSHEDWEVMQAYPAHPPLVGYSLWDWDIQLTSARVGI